GNWLDNIVFRSGTELTVKQEISYSGKTEISADTRSGYAYALAELRGSSAITLYDVSAYYDPDGAGSSPEAVRGPAVGLGDGEQWYAGLGDGGVITFRELTPGKTYRVIGIPELAINEDLGTNIYPADVLDEGYYKDIKIASAKDTDDAVVASVTAGIADDGKAAFVIVENSRSDVQYALRKAESGGAPDTQNPDGKGEWKDGGGSLVFPSLALGTVYYLVARPYGYAEISYADAVYGPEGLLVAVKIETPGEGGGAAADLRADQVGRAGDGMSITVTGTGAANTYAIVDPDTGTIVKTLPGTGEDITFSELDAAKTYQVMTKQSEHGVYTQGVRVYPFPGEITVDYKNGRIRLPADTDTEYVIKNADNDKYALGSADEWLTGAKNGYINLVDGDGKSAVFDALDGSDGKIESRRAPDGYVGAAVRPARVEMFPARPAAPVLEIDYAKELLELGTNAVTLEYTLNATGGVWEPPDKVEEDDGKILILFADLGWTGAARTVYLRIPAAEEQFASAVKRVTINARPSPPSGLSAKVEENGNDITFSGFDQEVPYDYGVENTEDTESGWKYQPIEYTAIGGGNYTIAYNANATYRFRISADNAPASLPVIVKPVPIVIEAVDFGEATYGYESITGQAVSVRNVSADEFHVSFEIVDVYASENEDDSKNNFTLGNKESLDSEGDSELDIAAGSTDNKSIVVTPATGRPAGTYTAKIKATYVKKPTEPAEPAEPTDPEETVEADVRLTVTKAEWKGIDVEIPKSGITENSFDVCVTNAPPGTEISLQGDETQYRTVGIDIEPFSFSDLDPQTAYTVRVETPYNDTNHNQYVGTFPVHTAMPLPKIDGEGADIDIDFINEMLVLSGG
ncbi:MAG: hypothetical protein LBH86_02300, partial [Oscillospiraceae bacterium]|nr:hypothetical protein [Oscillospiraceae bacterium]